MNGNDLIVIHTATTTVSQVFRLQSESLEEQRRKFKELTQSTPWKLVNPNPIGMPHDVRQTIYKREDVILDLADLQDYFAAEVDPEWEKDPGEIPAMLNRRIYKGTACGASISLHFGTGAVIHNGYDHECTDEDIQSGLVGFTIQTIVEGSDATVDSELFALPVPRVVVDQWIEYMESEAEMLWKEANEGEEDEEED
jgi:hypothetical protein